jgi:hypothetical protein
MDNIVAPSSFAVSSFSATISMAIMLPAPIYVAAIKAANLTLPSPKITIRPSFVGFSTFKTVPAPVYIAHPMGA